MHKFIMSFIDLQDNAPELIVVEADDAASAVRLMLEEKGLAPDECDWTPPVRLDLLAGFR